MSTREVAAIDAVRSACLDAGEPDPLDEAARLLLHDRRPDGVWIAEDDGVPAGFAWRHGTALDLAVAPARRDRGLGRALAGDATREPGPLTAWSHGGHPAAARLGEAFGFTRVRELWVMRRPAGDPLPPLDAGTVAIRAFRDTDLPDLLRLNAAAFAAHPEQGALDAAGFERRTREPWWDPAGLLIATDPDGRLVGFHWTKIADPARGEVYVVAVAPHAQGRGLGRLLTLAGLQHLIGRGVQEVELYVEADNAPAIAVYSGLGFAHAGRDTHVQWAR